jgi:hypothetical protein
MLSPRLTNCKECANIPDLLRKIDCKVAELGNNLYNNIVFMLNRDIAVTEISQLLAYKRILQHRFCDTSYAEGCPDVTTEEIASKVIRLTAGCIPFCNEPTVCEITTCAVKPCPNPTTTTTSTSSTSTTSTTSTSSTTTSTTTINCNFTGVIDCSITTTTTTTPPPTTTTTTTYFPDPYGVPCIWSTNGGNPGLVGVYDFDTDTQIDVLVPNDFNTTVGINRPIAATETHLYLTDGVVLNDSGSSTGDYVLLREWSIDATGVAPVLTYVREIKIETGKSGYTNVWGTAINTIAVAQSPAVGPSQYPGTSHWPEVPFTMLLLGMNSAGGNSAGVFSFDLDGGVLTPRDNALGYNSIYFGNTYGISTELSGNIVTTDNNVIYTSRFNEVESSSNAGNYVKQYNGLPPTNRTSEGNQGSFIPNSNINDWGSIGTSKPSIKLQDVGVPEFTESWTETKAMPIWGVNGLLQVLQPETNGVYTLSTVPSYEAILTTTIDDDSVWLSSAIPCANVNYETQDDIDGCTPVGLPRLVAIEAGVPAYIGPVTFDYFGQTVTATSEISEGIWYTYGEEYTTECGITIPENSVLFHGNNSNSFDNPAYNYTLTFETPVNNIPLRGSVFDTGDNFRFTTNAPTTVISSNTGCLYTIQNGNEVITDSGVTGGKGSGEVVITGSEEFTSLTITGTNGGNGGRWAMGCVSTTPTCTWARPSRGTAGEDLFYRYSPLSNIYELVDFDSSFGAPPDHIIGSGSSENIMFQYLAVSTTKLLKIKRWNLSDLSVVETPTAAGQGLNNLLIDYPSDEMFLAPLVMVVNDNTLLLNSVPETGSSGTSGKIYKLVINEDNTYTLTFLFVLESERTYWQAPIFSNNKIIYQRVNLEDIGDPRYIVQRDYTTLDVELEIDITYLDIAGSSPDGYTVQTSNQWMFVYENKMYILVSGIQLYEIDITFPYNTTLINNNTEFFGPGEFNNQYLRTWSNAGECNGNLSFLPSVNTTTTTSTNTTAVPGVRTIFTKFYPIVTNN